MQATKIVFVQDWLLTIMVKNNYQPLNLFVEDGQSTKFLSKEANDDLITVNKIIQKQLEIANVTLNKVVINPVDAGASETRVLSFLNGDVNEESVYEINMVNKTGMLIVINEGFLKKVLDSREETAKFFLACFVKAYTTLTIKEIANSLLLEKTLLYKADLSFI